MRADQFFVLGDIPFGSNSEDKRLQVTRKPGLFADYLPLIIPTSYIKLAR